jgi:shikimate dehydrogenase
MTGPAPARPRPLGNAARRCAIVYDARLFAPLQTGLAQSGEARARDLETVDGLDMLIGQAALAFELFFGKATAARVGCDEELRALLTAA